MEDPAVGRNTSWARRADYMRLMFAALLKYVPGYRSVASQFPRGRSVSLGCFGVGAKLQGLRVRPVFVMTSATENWVARNAVRQAISHQTGELSHLKSGRKRDGFLSLPPTYDHLVVAPLYVDSAISQFHARVQISPPRRRFRGKQKR